MARKHDNDVIEQLDGNNNFDENYTDEMYYRTRHYWETSFLGSGYQNFLDANDILEEVIINKKEREHEKDKVLYARKEALGDNYKYFPPWDRK